MKPSVAIRYVALFCGGVVSSCLAAEPITASDPIDLLLPRPVRVVRTGGTACLAADALTTVVRGPVPDAPSELAAEAYVLEIGPQGSVITASSPLGERYARVTLNQLAKLGGGKVPCCRVTDWPRLRWRGYLNDCGKNFLDLAGIRAILDVMAAYKMNLFLWHLTDYQGWRLESRLYPELQRPGSFLRQVGKYYTQDDFKAIVKYAAERGITIVPELDVPGHTLAFRKGLGLAAMDDPRVGRIVDGLIRELCGLVPRETMPFVHIGTDEVRTKPERCDSSLPTRWAKSVNACGRTAVVWAPGEKIDPSCDCIDMAWYDEHITNSTARVFDAARAYNAVWSPLDVLSRVTFMKMCRWDVAKGRQLGALTCTWHDDAIGEDTLQLFRECPVMPTIVGMADSFWSERRCDWPEFFDRMPSVSDPAFFLAVDMERRMLAQRDVVLKDFPHPFPFVRQTDMRWRITDNRTGRVLATDVAQGTMWIWRWNSAGKGRPFSDEKTGDVTAETWIHADEDVRCGAWIDMMGLHGVGGRTLFANTPKSGEWNVLGASIEINGKPLPPPRWKQPGMRSEREPVLDQDIPYSTDLLDKPMVDELPTLREPYPIHLRKGWNHVRMRLPKPVEIKALNWVGTFVPISGTSEHPREVPGLTYSARPPDLATPFFAPACPLDKVVRHLDFKDAVPAVEVEGSEMVLDNGTNMTVSSGRSWTVRLDQTAPSPVTVRAESRADDGNVSGGPGYSLYVDVKLVNGEPMPAQFEPFDTDPAAGWNQRCITIKPDAPIRQIVVHELFRKSTGRVRYRAPTVETWDERRTVMFDEVPCAREGFPAVNGPVYLIRRAGPSAPFVRASDADGLEFRATERLAGECRAHAATISLQEKTDQALTLAWTMPMPAGDLEYFPISRMSERLSDSSGNRSCTHLERCGLERVSTTPFLAVRSGRKGCAIGMDPTAPAFFRMSFNATTRLLTIAFDLGLTPEKPSADVRFVSFEFPADEGWRGALEAYMRIFPEAYAVRVPRQGNWMAFHDIGKVPDWQDFGFAYKEGSDAVDWEDRQGILSFHYTEPGTWWMPLQSRAGRKDVTYEEAVGEVRRLAGLGDIKAKSWMSSAMVGADGRKAGKPVHVLWCNGGGMVWSMNSAPGVAGDVTDWSAKIGDSILHERYDGKNPPDGFDGEYVDSAELYATTPLDFDRRHFKAMRTPLSFDPESGRPAIFFGFISYEYIRSLADRMRPIGRYVMANYTPNFWPWNVPYLDVIGVENNWNPGRWLPMSDEQLLYRRALCGAKPYCFLQNTDFSRFPRELTEKYMMRTIAYGMFPCFFSLNAYDGHYFKNPKFFERDRLLFKKFMPIVRLVAEAGWRPVNRIVTTSHPDVFSEQFGDPRGRCYATLFNLSSKPVEVEMTTSLRPTEELVSGEAILFAGGKIKMTLAGETLRVFVFDPNNERH